MDHYPIPAHRQQFTLEIKRSRFITTVACVQSKAEAKQILSDIRNENTDANHHCWAVVGGKPDDIYQHDQSDDGEPKGTAGKPILNVLQHAGLGNALVVVTRYFGGIKLGAGGLVRAYTQATTKALNELKTETAYIRVGIQVVMPYSGFDAFEHWLKDSNIIVVKKAFSEQVLLRIEVPESDKQQLEQRLEIAGGSASAIDL